MVALLNTLKPRAISRGFRLATDELLDFRYWQILLQKSARPAGRQSCCHPDVRDSHCHSRKLGQRFGDQRYPIGVVIAAPGEHPDAIAVAPADEAEPVVLDLVHPLRAGRDRAGERWQARLDETERGGSLAT